jgi:Putative adhesin
MRRIGLVVLAVALIGVVPASAAQWSKTYNVSAEPDLRVETSDANIRVDTSGQKTIEVNVISPHYKIGPGGLQIEEHQTGDTVEVNVRFPLGLHIMNIGNHRVDINIRMPQKGRVNLRTGDGNIELANFGGQMELSSGDGSETLHGVDGKLHASTGDGHITADGRFDALDLKTGDGRLDVRAAAGSTIADEWTMRTGDGNVNLELPENLTADLYLHTGDGHIDVNVPMTTEGRIKQNEVRGKMNGGGKLMTIQTGDGSISIHKG